MADPTRTLISERRDDRILLETRVTAFVIIPFLIAAFLILYVDGTQTARWFAWEIPSRLTTAFMGSGYLGGAYFFLRVGLGQRWHRVQAGFLPIAAFTATMLLSTLLHLDAFLTARLPFWIWLILYVLTPLLIPFLWWRNRTTDPRTPAAGVRLVPSWLRAVMAFAGGLVLLFCIAGFIWPQLLINIWPWTLSALTARVMASWHTLLGVGALTLAADQRWSAWPIPLQTIAIWQLLFLVALLWHRSEFSSSGLVNGFTLFVIGGLVGLLIVTLIMRSQPQLPGYD